MADFQRLVSTPKTVATVHRREDLATVASGSLNESNCDVLEFRLDNLVDHLDEAEKALESTPFPCLITARRPDEGGAGELSVDRRMEILRRFLPHAALIDIEARSLPEMASLVSEAQELGVGVVASAHNFEGPFSRERLEEIVEGAFASGADIAKIAMVLSSTLDLSNLIELTSRVTGNGSFIAAMGMGPLGKISRLTLAAAGSCLNYGYLGAANAPGQWPAAQLKQLIGEILPESDG